MEKNQRNPRRRLNSLILLVAFTAVMLIVSTYAWFSAQKTVTIGNLEGKVNVAEGIEISLDAVNWSQEIDFSDYHTAGGDIGQYNTSLAQVYPVNGETGKTHNVLPSELIPVSTTGTEFVDNTTTLGQEIAMFNGRNTEGVKLSDIIATDPTEASSAQDDFAGYYAIDLFLRNSSKLNDDIDGDGIKNEAGDFEVQGTAKETLQLNTNSTLELAGSGSTTTGLQNTVRVALALYKPYIADASTHSVDVTETSQAKILAALTGATSDIEAVSIWEPNADQHVAEILTNNNRISWTTTDAALYLTKEVNSATGADRLGVTDGKKVQEGEMSPTYALLAAAKSSAAELSNKTVKITDIYDWDGTNDGLLGKQIALQTKKSAASYTTVDGGVRNLINSWGNYDVDTNPTGPKASTGADVYEYGTASAVATTGVDAETGAEEFQIYKNQISRVRMYVWLEGQDIDCTNYASHGAGIHLDLGLVKGAIVGGMAES